MLAVPPMRRQADSWQVLAAPPSSLPALPWSTPPRMRLGATTMWRIRKSSTTGRTRALVPAWAPIGPASLAKPGDAGPLAASESHTMSTESIHPEVPPAPPAAIPTKRGRRTITEIDQALTAADGDITAAGAALGMAYHAVYFRIVRNPVLLSRWGSRKVKRALVKKIPKDLSKPEKLDAMAETGGRRAGMSLRDRRLMRQAGADGGAAFLPALSLCHAGALKSFLHIAARLDVVREELAKCDIGNPAKRLDYRRYGRLHRLHMQLLQLNLGFLTATTKGAELRFEAEYGVKLDGGCPVPIRIRV